MVLQTSGPISLSDVQTEFGGSGAISINQYYAGGAYVPAGTTGTNGPVPSSGQISLSNFYGIGVVISISNQTISDYSFGSQAAAWYYITGGGKIQQSTNADGSNPTDLETWCLPATATANYEVRVSNVSGTLYGNTTGSWLSMSSGTRSWYAATTYPGDSQIVTFTVDIRRSGNTTIIDTANITLDVFQDF